ARHAGFSLDTPFDQLGPAHQRVILHGTGVAWIVLSPWSVVRSKPLKRSGARDHGPRTTDYGPKFQYKGLFPAIDEASRVSFVYRHKLDHLVSDVPCSTCGGSRLRDDAAAV